MVSAAEGSSEPLHSGMPSGSDTTFAVVPDVTAESVAGQGEATHMVRYEDRDYVWQVPVQVQCITPFSGEIERITLFTSSIGVEADRDYLGLFFGGGLVDLKQGSLPDRAVKNPWWLEAGFVYRRYFSDPHTFISPYLTADVAFSVLHWDYRNPVIVEAETVRSDHLFGYGGYAGFGLAAQRKSHLGFFAEVGVGMTFFECETEEGFYNDVFDNYGYLSVKGGLTLKF